MDWKLIVQAVIGMLVITSPIDPVKIVFFNTIVARNEKRRVGSAFTVAIAVTIILGGAALVGRQALELAGIDLGAFGAVGGLILVLMGFEMLYNGAPSKAQGKEIEAEGPSEDSGLIMPLSIPLIAGPGAITTAIVMASAGGGVESTVAALIGVLAVGVTAFVSFVFLGGAIAKVSPKTLELLVRLGGLLLATLGFQLFLGGIRTFYGL